MKVQGVVDGLQSEQELSLALQYLEVGRGRQEVGLQDEDQVEVGEVGGDLAAEAPEELVSEPLIIESSLHEKSGESAVVIVLVFECLDQLEHEHLNRLVLHLGSTGGTRHFSRLGLFGGLFEEIRSLEKEGAVKKRLESSEMPETLDGVLVYPLVRIFVVQQLEGVLELDDGPGPQQAVELLHLAVVLVVDAVNDPGDDGLVQSLAVILQSHQQVLLL